MTFLLLFVPPALAQTPLERRSPLEVTVSLVQLNGSHGRALWGGQLRVTSSLHERVELVESLTVVRGDERWIAQNDARVRLWGQGAGPWYPAIAVETGYLVQSEDWLATDGPRELRHGPLFGGTWEFPLAELDQGAVLAKWAYAIRFGTRNMTIFNCHARWHFTEQLGVHVGGDIYTAYGALKYSGFTVGGTGSIAQVDP